MARMLHDDAKQFENNNTYEIFSLADDQDSERVQILVNIPDDILAYTVHEVPDISSSGKPYTRKVSCLKTSKDDLDGICPLCDSGQKIKVSRFIPVYSYNEGVVKLWERSGKFIDTNLFGFIRRMQVQNGIEDMKNLVVDIVRNGKRGDNKTTYAFYPMERVEPKDVSGIEIPEVEGGIIALWDKKDMNYYVTTGNKPEKHNSSENSENNVEIKPRTRSYNENLDSFNTSPLDNPEEEF